MPNKVGKIVFAMPQNGIAILAPSWQNMDAIDIMNSPLYYLIYFAKIVSVNKSKIIRE
jgi:hypothetical protein